MKKSILLISLLIFGCSSGESFQFSYPEFQLLLKQKEWVYVSAEISLRKCNPELFAKKNYGLQNESIKLRVSIYLNDTLRTAASTRNSVHSFINEVETKNNILPLLDENLKTIGLCTRSLLLTPIQGK